MAKDRNDIIQDIGYWKMAISSVENIPLNPNHNYKDENNIYERLTEYVKDWTESIFGLYTQQDGSLANLPEDEEGPECKEWFETVGRKLTPMADDWYQVAVKGEKEGKFLTLPQMNQNGMDDVSEILQTRDDIKNAVRSTFFPAYRALRDSFSNRSIFQWIFNHKQYVAERDALKVMTSLITSMTGYTQKELDAEYIQHQKDFTKEEIANHTIEYSNREVNIYEPEDAKELFKDEKTKSLEVKVNQGGKINRLEGVRDELLAHGNYDGYFEDVMPTDEVLDIDYDEVIEDNMTAEEKLEKFDDEGIVDELCGKFMKALKTTEANEDAIWRALHVYMYEPMHDSAKRFCAMYEGIKYAGRGADFKEKFAKLTKSSAKNLFETAFKVLGEEDPREIVKTVNGKEVREKVGGSLFGINTLKDRIVAAQKIANIVLANRTPASFYPELSGDLVNTVHIFENADSITEYIKANYGKKYGESEINAAMKFAKNEFGVTYRGEKPLTSYCFEIGYRPDLSQIFVEQKVLGNAQKMIKKGLITDETTKAIVNANVSKWKAVSDMQKPGTKLKMKDVEKKWIESDKKLAESYKDYDAAATESAVVGALEQYNTQKKEKPEPVNVDLKDDKKVAIVPPVEQKPVTISAPKREK